MDALWSDLRHAVRSLRKSPAFTVVAVVTLALGIGASAVVFAVVKTVLLNPLPYRDPDRLVTVVEADSHILNPETVSYATVQDWRRRTQLFDHLSRWTDFGVRPIRNGQADQLRGMRVDADFFEMLGVQMFLGRSFRADEDTPGGRNVLILTYDTWSKHFGGDLTIVGRTIPTVDGSYTVVGILPRGFQPLHMSNPAELPQLFTPMGFDARQQAGRSASWRILRVIGRLKTGTTSRQAEVELNIVMHALAREYPEYPPDASAIVKPLQEKLVGTFGATLWMLQASVLVLLALACANVATLLLARIVGRQTELGIRAALGAGRMKLIRQLLTECMVLGTAAAAGGVVLAWLATQLIARSGDTNIPRIGELAPDRSMLLFGIAASAATTLLFGVVPAVIASSRSFATLRTSQGVAGRRSHHATVRVLITVELAFACVLVLAVGLLSKSYLRLMQVNPGYDPQHVLTLSLLPDGAHYATPAVRLGYFDAVVDRMRAIPGVQDAGYASTLPLSHPSTSAVHIREHPRVGDADAPILDLYLVSTNYLDVMKIPVTRGRSFTAGDSPMAQRVAIVSESTARTQFSGEDAIGRHIQIERRDDGGPWAVIVGVVGDVHQYGLDRAPDAAVYVPFGQVDGPSQGWASLVVRSTPPAERIESAVRGAMLAVDPLQPIFHLQPMMTYVALSLSQRTFALALIAAFAVLGLALAAGGVYGVVSYVVEQRTREIGLRLALGATAGAVGWGIVRQVMVMTLTGVSCGLVVAAAFTNVLADLLFGVTRFDLDTTCEVALTLIAAALVASAAPIARAVRVDPMVALRSE